jgi:hypothetical protein
VVGPAVCNYIREVLDGWSSVAEINQTFLVLIPKVAKPESVLQFRPISLCNVNFKILTKVIVNRLKPMIPNLVSKHQSIVIKPRPAWRVDPGAGLVRVCQKTGQCNDPVKPGRPGGSTRDPGDPGKTRPRPRVLFFSNVEFEIH